MLTFRKSYLALAILIFTIEVLIALYMHDAFVRPYVGDYLVVILIYCLIRAFFKIAPIYTALITLVIAYVTETLQYLNVLSMLGWENNATARLLLGSSFEWGDMLAYTLGVATIYWLDKK